MTLSPFVRVLWISSLLVVTDAKQGFVLLGPTGDNALRDNGVWQGLFEAWTAGVFDSSTVGIHPTMNTPNNVTGLEFKFLGSVTPLYEKLQETAGWECKQPDCSPKIMWNDIEPNVNIWEGRDANAQAEDMIPALEDYDRISVYLSIPPSAFGGWAVAAADNWGAERTIVAAEKPFGTSTEGADELFKQISDALPADNLKIVDHWLSFFMIKNLPKFQHSLEAALGCEEKWNECFEKIVVTEHEVRGLEGRGSFFDGVGQVRDLIQSHLLQTFSLAVIDHERTDVPEAKLEVLDQLNVTNCVHGQYDGWLFEDGLSYHPDFADATYSTMMLKMTSDEWKDVAVEYTTGKLMGIDLYTIDFYQKDGPGVMTIDIGAEEVGVADIKVSNWPLADSSEFEAPLPGFDDDAKFTATPSVSAEGDGFILSYDPQATYFPAPYAVMLKGMIEAKYGDAFVTYPEVHQSWVVVTADDDSLCLDPPGKNVDVYNPPDSCDNTPPDVCYTGETVQDLYDVTFACTAEHDDEYADVDFYQAKCHPPTDSPTASPGDDDDGYRNLRA